MKNIGIVTAWCGVHANDAVGTYYSMNEAISPVDSYQIVDTYNGWKVNTSRKILFSSRTELFPAVHAPSVLFGMNCFRLQGLRDMA